MNILVTGSAGFIGYHLCNSILNDEKTKVYGIDNLNNYYSVKLKRHRLNLLKKKKKFFFFQN
jgi:UDP-glucuronate 4-epimerase